MRCLPVLCVALAVGALPACQDDSSGRRLPVFVFDGGAGGADARPGPLDAAFPDPADVAPLSDAVAGQAPGRLVIASYNVENLFDLVDDPSHDELEFTPRPGTWDAARLAIRIQRLVQVVRAIGADVLLVNEVESLDVLTDLRDALDTAGGPHYPEVHVVASRDPRGIGIGVLSRFPVKLEAGRPISLTHDCEGPDGITTLDGSWPEARPIYQVEIDFEGDGATDLLLLGNHWKAKGRDSFPCTDEEHRLRSALQLRQVFDDLLADDPTLPIIALGDFNTFEFEAPLADALRATLDPQAVQAPTDLFNAWGDLGVVLHDRNSNAWNNVANSSYQFSGDWTRLDHLILSGNMRPGGEAALRWAPGTMATVRPAFLLGRSGAPLSYDINSGEGYSDHLPIRLTLLQAE